MSKPSIQAALAQAEADLARKTDISKATVIGELRAAIGVAEGKMDAGSMIRACAEMAKMLGFYSPETIRVAVTAESDAQRAKFDAMSDDQLLAIARGGAAA